MLDAAREASGYIRDRNREDLEINSMLRRALKDCIQEIGEAASKVTEEGRSRSSELPWKQIVGMRHRIVHVYYDIDTDALWEVAVRDLPVLIESLQRCLKDWTP